MGASLPYGHGHVSERQPGPWLDCTWCSGVMFAHDTDSRAIPLTHAENDRLRAADGDQGISNLDDLRNGLRIRYNMSGLIKWDTFREVWDALDPGTAGVVQGAMSAWPYGHRYRRFDPNYRGGHAAYVARTDTTLTVWWDDPLAPQAGGYRGEQMSRTDLERFFDAGPAGVGAVARRMLPIPVVDPIPYDHVVAATETVNIRARASAASAIKGQFNDGERFNTDLLKKSGGRYKGPGGNWRTDWLGFRRNGVTNWVARGYTRLIK